MLFAIDAPEKHSHDALIDASSGQKWTYAQLVSNVRLRQDCFPDSGLLFLFCRNSLDTVALYLAAVEAGQAVALLNARLDRALQDNLLSLYRPDWISGLDGPMPPSYRDVGNGLWRRASAPPEPLFPELRLLLSTSGSTGSPKLVRLTRGNLESNARSIAAALRISPDHRPVAHLPLFYSYGLSVLNSHLAAGATILLSDRSLIDRQFWADLRHYQVDSFSGVPYTYQMLRRLVLDRLDVPRLRILTQAGGKLDDETIAHFSQAMQTRGGGFWVMYGQTEATARITVLPAECLPQRLGSVGGAIPGGSLKICTSADELTSQPGITGELVFEGPNVMLGYARDRADLAKGDELAGRLYTADRALLEDGGFARILGRTQRDAKVFGLRMNLDEIESLVRAHGPLAAVANRGGITIFCEFGNAAQFEPLRDELAARLKVHRSAFDFRRIERLPTRASGKIAYESLQDLL